jgi:hypothetical protein
MDSTIRTLLIVILILVIIGLLISVFQWVT